jgi:hypothetical protein
VEENGRILLANSKVPTGRLRRGRRSTGGASKEVICGRANTSSRPEGVGGLRRFEQLFYLRRTMLIERRRFVGTTAKHRSFNELCLRLATRGDARDLGRDGTPPGITHGAQTQPNWHGSLPGRGDDVLTSEPAVGNVKNKDPNLIEPIAAQSACIYGSPLYSSSRRSPLRPGGHRAWSIPKVRGVLYDPPNVVAGAEALRARRSRRAARLSETISLSPSCRWRRIHPQSRHTRLGISRAPATGSEFVADSPLEEAGFEPSVPPRNGSSLRRRNWLRS